MMDNVALALVSIPAGLFVFSLIIVIHELGHFWVARACGVKVEAFSIGFGSTLVSWRDKHGVLWRIAALPLGGYVRFFGDASGASNPDRGRLEELRAEIDAEHGAGTAAQCFHFKPLWQRAAVVAAGPFANFILAIVIFAGLAWAFGGQAQRGALISEVREDSPAAVAGFVAGDRIISADGREITLFAELSTFVSIRGGEDVRFGVERGGQTLFLDTTIGRAERPGPLDRPVMVGFLGVVASNAPENTVRSPVSGPFEALGEGVAQTWAITENTVRFIGRIFQGKESPENIGGAPRIAGISGEIAKDSMEAATASGAGALTGFGYALINLLQLAAILSVGIGLLNLLPIPVLDGGHLLYYAYEGVVGRPLAAAAQEWGFRVGLALIVGLMVFVFVNDLRFFARI